MHWLMDLLTTCIHDSEVQVIIALSLMYALYKSLHAKSSPACSILTRRCMVTIINNGDSSASVVTPLPVD
jgi:hypothetical protein